MEDSSDEIWEEFEPDEGHGEYDGVWDSVRAVTEKEDSDYNGIGGNVELNKYVSEEQKDEISISSVKSDASGNDNIKQDFRIWNDALGISNQTEEKYKVLAPGMVRWVSAIKMKKK